MSKKKDKKSKEKKTFSKMLKENASNIKLDAGDGITLDKQTQNTLENVIATQVSSLIPVPVSEAVKNADTDVSRLSLSTVYAESIFSLYEFALKNTGVKQTLVLYVPEDEIEDIFDDDYPGYGPLKDRTNLKLILDKFPDKARKRLFNWQASVDGNGTKDMFVIRIPDIVIFHGDIKKDQQCKSKLFDLVITVLHAERKMTKLKKKDGDAFAEASAYYVDTTVSVLRKLGVSSAHINLCSDLFDDPHDYAKLWTKHLFDEKDKILTRLLFCTSDPNVLVSFNAQVKEDLLGEVGVILA